MTPNKTNASTLNNSNRNVKTFPFPYLVVCYIL